MVALNRIKPSETLWGAEKVEGVVSAVCYYVQAVGVDHIVAVRDQAWASPVRVDQAQVRRLTRVPLKGTEARKRFDREAYETRDRALRLAEADRIARDPRVYAHAAALVRQGWVRGSFAEDNSRKPVDIQSPSATCFCIMGAVVRAGFDLGLAEPRIPPGDTWSSASALGFDLVPQVREALGPKAGDPRASASPNYWNNQKARTAEEVIAALEAADPARVQTRYIRP